MTNVVRQTGCTFSRRLCRQATVVTRWSEALRTMYPTRRSREADGITESNTRYGTSLGYMVNGRELLINPVTLNKPKLLIGLGQKASGKDVSLLPRYTRSTNPPGDRQNLNTQCHHCGTWEPLPFAQNIGQGNHKEAPWTEGIGRCKKLRPASNRVDMLTCTGSWKARTEHD
jgi:hypothetical protein